MNVTVGEKLSCLRLAMAGIEKGIFEEAGNLVELQTNFPQVGQRRSDSA